LVIVTLLTDFGTRDVYAGVMRGVITGIAPEAQVVDLTHGVAPQAVDEAAFLLASAAPYFAAGTVHLAVVDPGVGTKRRVLCVETAKAVYVAPDNGLLPRALAADPPRRVVSVEERSFFLPAVSRTFHGRDVFSPVAAHVAAGVDLDRLGPQVPLDSLEGWGDGRLEGWGAPPVVEGLAEGRVVHIDHFGNLVTDVAVDPGARVVWAEVDQDRIEGPALDSYAACGVGELMLIVGSHDTVEVSINQGHAARSLGTQRGAKVKVSFEARRNPGGGAL
jgi:S-adenosyl-L-methionine hydrolase (adenosine-forming)